MKIVVDHDRTAMAAVLEDWNFKYQQFQMCPPANAGMASAEAEETWRRVKEISTDTLNTIGRLVDHLGAMPGRRDLIIASSGFLGASMEEQKSRIIDRALRAGVVISALDSKGLFIDYGLPDPTRKVENEYKRTEQSGWVMAMNEPMAALAEATGGVYYHNNNDLTAGFREMGSPDYTYRISFRPDGVTPDGSYHKLKVKVVHAKGNYSLQARPGYGRHGSRISLGHCRSKRRWNHFCRRECRYFEA
jgi:VWFA-related protein